MVDEEAQGWLRKHLIKSRIRTSLSRISTVTNISDLVVRKEDGKWLVYIYRSLGEWKVDGGGKENGRGRKNKSKNSGWHTP